MDPGYGGAWSPTGSSTISIPAAGWVKDTVSPVAVYVTWNPNGDPGSGNHWTSHAEYDVYDGSTLLTTVPIQVDQSQSPGNESPEPNDRPWKLLGVWNIPVGDTLTVVLQNDGTSDPGGMLCAGDAMIHPLWPTVTIRADLDGTGTFGEKDDFLAACNPAEIPVDGSGFPDAVAPDRGHRPALHECVQLELDGETTQCLRRVVPEPKWHALERQQQRQHY